MKAGFLDVFWQHNVTFKEHPPLFPRNLPLFGTLAATLLKCAAIILTKHMLMLRKIIELETEVDGRFSLCFPAGIGDGKKKLNDFPAFAQLKMTLTVSNLTSSWRLP